MVEVGEGEGQEAGSEEAAGVVKAAWGGGGGPAVGKAAGVVKASWGGGPAQMFGGAVSWRRRHGRALCCTTTQAPPSIKPLLLDFLLIRATKAGSHLVTSKCASTPLHPSRLFPMVAGNTCSLVSARTR